MNRFVVLAFSVQLAGPVDRWFSSDKAKHFFLGAFIQSASFSLLRASTVDEKPSLLAATAISVATITAKELRDRRGLGTPSAKDAIWGLAGAAAISPVLAKTK